MLYAGRVAWRALRHFNQRGALYIWANFIAFVCMIPVVTAPAAWAGLVYLHYLARTTPRVDLEDFRDGVVRQVGRGIVVLALNIAVLGINLVNLTAYAEAEGELFAIMRVVWMGALLIWVGAQVYLWPIYYHMEHPTLWGALRNAVLMVIFNPIFSLSLLVIATVIIAASTALVAAWPLLTLSALASLATEAVFDRLGIATVADPGEVPLD
jgi:hypothetical protein